MTGFDIVVLVAVGAAAITGFLRGFVQEVLALAAWVVALAAIHYLHSPLTLKLIPYTGDRLGSAAVLAFVILLMLPYFIIKMMARRMGEMSRNSLLGPIDRAIGFGFGTLKGVLVVVLGFSVLVLGYDTVWGVGGRPDWITQARTYPFVDAASRSLVKMIGDRRSKADDAAAADVKKRKNDEE